MTESPGALRGVGAQLQRDFAHKQEHEPISLALGTMFSKDSDLSQVSSQKKEKQVAWWVDEAPSHHPTPAPVSAERRGRKKARLLSEQRHLLSFL